MGHEGKDPGEYDLLCAYYYNFDPKLKTWSRNVIYFNERAGFGLDPRAADARARTAKIRFSFGVPRPSR